MNRPACIRHMLAHVAARRVTGLRLRPPEVEPLVRYIEHLERQAAASVPVGDVCGAFTPHTARQAFAVVTTDPVPCVVEGCTLDAGHTGECAQVMTA
jgi:hypothetical protein